MPFLLGPVGALQELPDPVIGMPSELVRKGGIHQLLGGSQVQDTLSFKRTWTLSWDSLTIAEYQQIELLYLRAVPLGFHEPLTEDLPSGTVPLVHFESLSRARPLFEVVTATATLREV